MHQLLPLPMSLSMLSFSGLCYAWQAGVSFSGLCHAWYAGVFFSGLFPVWRVGVSFSTLFMLGDLRSSSLALPHMAGWGLLWTFRTRGGWMESPSLNFSHAWQTGVFFSSFCHV